MIREHQEAPLSLLAYPSISIIFGQNLRLEEVCPGTALDKPREFVVHVFPVPDVQNDNPVLLPVNLVDHPVVAHSQPPESRWLQLVTFLRPPFKLLQQFQNTAPNGGLELLQRFCCLSVQQDREAQEISFSGIRDPGSFLASSLLLSRVW